MSKFQLQIDYDFDFRLIGISCHARDYRLCWALNNHLEIQLEKVLRENASSGLKKNGIAMSRFISIMMKKIIRPINFSTISITITYYFRNKN